MTEHTDNDLDRYWRGEIISQEYLARILARRDELKKQRAEEGKHE